MENQNYLWLRGQKSYTDKDFIETFNLDPSLEGKPEINDAMLDVTHKINMQHYMDANNMTEEDARSKADAIRDNTRADIHSILGKK